MPKIRKISMQTAQLHHIRWNLTEIRKNHIEFAKSQEIKNEFNTYVIILLLNH